MSEWDTGTISTAGSRLAVPSSGERDPTSMQSRLTALEEFLRFLRTYQESSNYIYREALIAQYRRDARFLEVDIGHVGNYSSQLQDLLIRQPNEYLPVFEDAAHRCLVGLLGDRKLLAARDEAALRAVGGGRVAGAEGEEGEEGEDGDGGGDVGAAEAEAAEGTAALERKVPRLQVTLVGRLAATPIRHVAAANMNRLVCVANGIVVNASRGRPKAHRVCIRCAVCNDTRMIPVEPAFGGFRMPRQCLALRPSETAGMGNPGSASNCGMDPYVVLPDRSEYVDHQTMKLQEAPEDVPTGEMPRHMLVSVERSLVDRVAPGTRVNVLGVVSVVKEQSKSRSRRGGGAEEAVGVRRPYLRVLGIQVDAEGAGRASSSFTPEEEAEFRAFAASGNAYERLSASVAPAIAGSYAKDIKHAILCLLLAGSRKMLRDGMRIRGDINVLLLGDPSTAKSQFLKFVERAAPVGVYTSGKGSSAAGLTASVTRDSKGEFYLEGGAMVLADGGVVCIDEFDKMREEDRVAIHEAMEQQTISVAKAGITTILNSRAAVLAAANPVFGRYDDAHSAAENINFLPTILSRFDLIFIVRDVREEQRDRGIARAVMQIHINAGAEDPGDEEASGHGAAGELDLAFLRRYVAYARAQCAPRISPTALEALRDEYVKIRARQRARRSKSHDDGGSEESVIPITVRQLEALIRISEAVAKARLATDVSEHDAREAIRLFKSSTLEAATAGLDKLVMSEEMTKRVKLCVNQIKNDVKVGVTVSYARLKRILTTRFQEQVVTGAIQQLRTSGELNAFAEGARLRRVK